MAKHVVSITVQVVVEANTADEAQSKAFTNAHELIKKKEAVVTSATHVRQSW